MRRWRSELRAWSNEYAAEWAQREGILGVMIGGSLARGQEWQHSDLELGILFAQTDRELPYFNVDAGRGVEIIQLLRDQLTEQIDLVEGGDWMPVVKWPIQLWQGRIIYDPSGLLGRFKRVFDDGLFQDQVLDQKVADLNTKIQRALDEARALVRTGRPAAALAKLRLAMNDTILAFHWAHKELPRSQNRTHSRVRHICRKYSAPSFFALYREVFDLDSTNRVVQKLWPNIREDVLEITRLWGDSAYDFFDHAVDSHFEWRQNASILTVYRLYLPIIGEGGQGIFAKLDDRNWATQNKLLMEFLGLTDIDPKRVSALIDRVASVSLVLSRSQEKTVAQTNEPGQIIILNGAPRSGKSSIIAVIQDTFDGLWMNLGVDRFMQMTPARYLPGIGLRGGGERQDIEPLVPILYAALYESIAAHSRLGLNVVVDVGHHDAYAIPRGILPACARRLSGLPVLFVGVRCPIETIMERRHTTGWNVGHSADAPIPQPVYLWQQEVHMPGIYDLEVDTSVRGPAECAMVIRQYLDHGPTPSAFQRLAALAPKRA